MDTRFILKLFDSGFIFRAGMVLLGLSLIILGEFFLLEFLSGFWGIYFTLALAAATGLAGVFLSYREISARIALVKQGVVDGVFLEKDMIQLAGAIVAGLFLLLPGFITDVFGALGFFSVVRSLYGRLATWKMSPKLNKIYEYMRLYD